MHRLSPRRHHRLVAAALLGSALALPATAPRAQSQRSLRQRQGASQTASAAGTAAVGVAAGARRTRPSPALSPEQVVSIQLDALQHNDTPTRDHGIEISYAFTAPENRLPGGPLDRFADVARGSLYAPMLNHRSVERGPMHVQGDEARQRVTVVSESGTRVTYIFMLSRQRGGEYDGCWMTDGVARINDTGPRVDGLRSA